jgi:hypothetical protein
MRNLPSLVVSAVSTWDGKALGKGEKQLGGFEKGVKNLAKTLGATFGAAAMLSYGKNAVKAFAENEKSAKRLETVLKNLGLGFETSGIERNLDDISAKFGYEGEVLRESFQKLVMVTGSVTKSQDLLNLSLDVAAGSGEDLLTINEDLAGVYVGNTKGLKKYNLGLAQSELKTLGFNEAVEKLTTTFAGSATAELETYAGKMRVLQEASDNAQEIIGGALIEAFMKLAGDTTVEDLNESVENLAESLAAVVELTGAVATPFVGLAKLFDNASMAYTKFLYKVTGATFFGDVSDRQYGGAAAEKYKAEQEKANAKARAAAEAAAAKRQKELLALQKKSALAEKNKLSLSKAAAVFDTNRISIAAALRATYDKDTILRLEALQAIEEDNGELALKKIGELAAFQKNADLAKLAGITQISEATLSALNTQLLAELKVINDSKMAESDKEVARQIAFGKYNEAITKAGELAAKESYSERVQIQLTEIAKLASLSKTSNAALTLTKLRESEELSMIDRVAAAQKRADDARLSALQTYINALSQAAKGPSANAAAIQKMTPSEAEIALAKEPVSVATALTPAQISGIRYAAQAQDAYEKSLSQISLTNAVAQGSLMQGLGSGLTLSDAASGARYAAQAARAYNITINAGAIASQDEFTTLLQDTIQKINRDGDPLLVAGTL